MIDRLHVENVRVIQYAHLTLHPRLNLIIGNNGSGKTSLFEAVQILATGKSFRTKQADKVIRVGCDELLVSSIKQDGTRIGIKRRTDGTVQARINAVNQSKVSALASEIPVFTVTPAFYQDFFSKRSERLKFLDWIVFHVEHSFGEMSQRYKRALSQRNALLKQIKKDPKIHISSLDVWDEQLSELTSRINENRAVHLKEILGLLFQLPSISDNFTETPLNVSLRSGWKGDSINECLSRQREQDIRLGYTQSGAHRADLSIKMDHQLASDMASRGQQKVIINGLINSFVRYSVAHSNKGCLLIIDDLPAELDKDNQVKLLKQLLQIDGLQLMVSAIAIDSLPDAISGYNKRMFHVEHGQFTEL